MFEEDSRAKADVRKRHRGSLNDFRVRMSLLESDRRCQTDPGRNATQNAIEITKAFFGKHNSQSGFVRFERQDAGFAAPNSIAGPGGSTGRGR